MKSTKIGAIGLALLFTMAMATSYSGCKEKRCKCPTFVEAKVYAQK